MTWSSFTSYDIFLELSDLKEWDDLIKSVHVDAATKRVVFSKKNKSNMNFLKQCSAASPDKIPHHVWDTVGSIAVHAHRFTAEELSNALSLLSMALNHGAEVEEFFLNGNAISVQQRNLICDLIPRIKSVHMACCTLDEDFFDSLTQSFIKIGTLATTESISSYDCKLSEDQQIDYWKCVRYVQKLIINREKITLNSMRTLSEEVCRVKQKSNPFYYHKRLISHIAIRDCALDDEQLEIISKFAPFVKTLDIDISDQEAYVKGEGLSKLSESIIESMEAPLTSIDVCLEHLSLSFSDNQKWLIEKMKMCFLWMRELPLNCIGSGYIILIIFTI